MQHEFDIWRDHLYSKNKNLDKLSDLEKETYIFDLYGFQYKYNKIYNKFCNFLSKQVHQITSVDQIPHLPINAFKYHSVTTGDFTPELIFKSSGTTQSQHSYHYIRDKNAYLFTTKKIWEHQFPKIKDCCFLNLLPGYIERGDSSLVAMVHHFIDESSFPQSGFYLHNYDELSKTLIECLDHNIPTFVFGVTYALLDFFEKYSFESPSLTIVETGGMKGQRQEWTKKQLHEFLSLKAGTKRICSEYGMTELCSQVYSMGDVFFRENDYFKCKIMQINDPLSLEQNGKQGIIAITDFSNIDSCAFIITEDTGIKYANHSFEILGRISDSDLRGCNLLVT